MSNKPLDLDAVKCRYIATKLAESEEERKKRTRYLRNESDDREEVAFRDAIGDFYDLYLASGYAARLVIDSRYDKMTFGASSIDRKSLSKLVSLPIILEKCEWVLDSIGTDTYTEGGFYASDAESTIAFVEITFKRKKKNER